MKQAQAFLVGEGDAWLERNKQKLPPRNDPVIDALVLNSIMPERALEIGCADGWRLKRMSDIYLCEVAGLDPRKSDEAWIEQGTARSLPYKDNAFDVIIYGFCLYLCDREDLFKIVTEGDRVLVDGGHLVIHDFHPEYPHKRAYKHCNNIYSYKMDYAKLWLGNPAYKLVTCMVTGLTESDESVSILKKDVAGAWPTNE